VAARGLRVSGVILVLLSLLLYGGASTGLLLPYIEMVGLLRFVSMIWLYRVLVVLMLVGLGMEFTGKVLSGRAVAVGAGIEETGAVEVSEEVEEGVEGAEVETTGAEAVETAEAGAVEGMVLEEKMPERVEEYEEVLEALDRELGEVEISAEAEEGQEVDWEKLREELREVMRRGEVEEERMEEVREEGEASGEEVTGEEGYEGEATEEGVEGGEGEYEAAG